MRQGRIVILIFRRILALIVSIGLLVTIYRLHQESVGFSLPLSARLKATAGHGRSELAH
jgi:hypothetical protein